MSIDEAMDRFGRLPGTKVGRGPENPRQPDPARRNEITEFLSQHEALLRDGGYVQFLLRYAGASWENQDATALVDILGFTDAATDMLEMDGPVVDEDGFLLFAQRIEHVIRDGKLLDTRSDSFAFDMTGERRPGVYQTRSSINEIGNVFEWCTDTFETWLGDLVYSLTSRPEVG